LGYIRRLYLAFAALAFLAILLAGLGWYMLQEAEHRVLRGRIASDIYTAVNSFSADKTALRNWSYRRILGQPATSLERDRLIEGLNSHLTTFAEMNAWALQMDQGRRPPVAEDETRAQTLTLLRAAVVKLDAKTRELLPQDLDGRGRSLTRIDDQFDRSERADLPELLAESLRQEQRLLAQERARADQGLTDARRLFVGTASSGVILSLTLALWLSLRLRRPLRRLDVGLRAYGRGDFTHRFDGFRDAEFVRLGDQLNDLAAEVTQHRQQEANFRADLERAVDRRTQDLAQALDELVNSEQARQRLLADIGHELRTPVTVIRGEAQVALRGSQDNPGIARAALGRIVEVTRQMGRLIEDLLVFARTPDDQLHMALRDAPLASSLDPALDIAVQNAAQHGVQLAVAPWDRAIHVLADPDRLRQVLTCLLDNAIRYSHPEGRIDLAITDGPDEVTLSIADQGIGIDPADLPHLFTRGWRSAGARAFRPDGLGLGLPIAHQLVAAQGGKLVLTAGEKGGVIATLRLSRGAGPQAWPPQAQLPQD
ncbi:MAG: HAMP domain-containing histidine kinase, partial [Paracoccus sp. (in: a-proteobacteria)]|nr:HAMP domain-containing histidine kinase [Paracoccus sp. (in: a-proteobacteria)]